MKVSYLCLIFICSLGSALGEDAFNKMIDRVLAKLTNDLDNGTSTIQPKLPDVNVPFHKNFLWYVLKGDVELKQGIVQSMSGLKKIGDASLVATNDGDMIISLTVGWTDLTLYYGLFNYKYLFLDIDDSLTLKVNDNSILFNATFSYGRQDSCKMSLNQAQITSFKGFTGTLKSSHWYRFLDDFITDLAMGDQSSSIEQSINQHLTDISGDILQQLDLCHYLPY